MLVDANLLLFAAAEQSRFHDAAASWLTEQLRGSQRLALPWLVLGAFLRVVTNPRITTEALSPEAACDLVRDWLDLDITWVPEPGPGYSDIFLDVVTRNQVTGNLIPDAMLAALAIEHGLTVASADADFARFTEIRWVNPLATST